MGKEEGEKRQKEILLPSSLSPEELDVLGYYNSWEADRGYFPTTLLPKENVDPRPSSEEAAPT